MTRTLRLPLAAAALLLAAACAAPGVNEPANAAASPGVSEPSDAVIAPPTGAPADASAPTPEEPAMICQADKGQWAVGQLADETLVAKIQADTTSRSVRIIKPGMAVTMDYREDRVNLDVDADNRVLTVRCT